MGYDAIVVGGGTAGCVVAARLSEDRRRRVLLLEAGPDYPAGRLSVHVAEITERTPDEVWGYAGRTHPSRTDLVPFPAGRVVGGSSAVNGGVFLRGLREDFDGWARRGCPEWTYERVLPYFQRCETDPDCGCDYHGHEGPIVVRRPSRDQLRPEHDAFLRAAERVGFPFQACLNAPDAVGAGIVPFNSAGRRRLSTALAYLEPARERPNLEIAGDVTVTRVAVMGGRATGVEFLDHRERRTVEANEVIISCGAIGSPHLLQRSGIGRAGAGRNLRDHPYVPVRLEIPEGAVAGGAANPQVCARTEEVTLFGYARVAHHKGPMPAATAPAIGCMLNRPLASGTVRAEPEGPGIEFDCLTDERDRARLREGVRLAVALVESAPLRELGARVVSPAAPDLASDPALDRWLEARVRTGLHAAGSCRMGPASDATAVVDPECRLHGLGGLRVIDASIMPDLVSANTNASTIMLAERSVEFAI